MNTFKLEPFEESALNSITKILGELKQASQHKVLKKLAHLMNREVVRPGAVRTAAIVAAQGANRTIVRGDKPTSENPKGGKKKGTDHVKLAWEATDEAKHLIGVRDELKAMLKGREPNVEEKNRIAVASKNLRESLQIFRTNAAQQAVGQKTTPSQIGQGGDAGDEKSEPANN